MQVTQRMLLLLAVMPLLVAFPLSLQAAETPYTVEWIRQLGTWRSDYSYGVAADAAGNAYISGYTYGNLGGPNAGSWDAFLRKYDPEGNALWTRQLGTSGSDYGVGVAVDVLGNTYITGDSNGSLGGPNAGYTDAFLSKYDADGNALWTRQLGTMDYDYSLGVAVDAAGNAYISGYTDGNLGGPNAGGADAFLSKYDAEGNVLWTRQLGSAGDDHSHAVAVDALGNAYISGHTDANLWGPNAGGTDAFLSKYDADGNALWTRQLGTADDDWSYGVAVDAAGNAYISGYTDGNLGGPNAGGTDAFLSKYDADGNAVWTRQLGTTSDDHSHGVALDAAGNAYISGHTWGSLDGLNAGFDDAFLSKYDANGNLLWTEQLGTVNSDRCFSVALDGLGNAYISGDTDGNFGGPNAGYEDAFLAKFAYAFLVGDMDRNGKIDTDDINPFVLALTDPNSYVALYGLDPNDTGDCDGDGVLTVDDIQPFVGLLTGGGAVPEPAALSMFCGAAAGVLLKRRRKS